MRRETLSIARLAPWARLNNVELNGVDIAHLPDINGSGLLANRRSSDSMLMSVPRDLVLSSENVWIYAKSDKDLLEVLEAVGDYARVLTLHCNSNSRKGKD